MTNLIGNVYDTFSILNSAASNGEAMKLFREFIDIESLKQILIYQVNATECKIVTKILDLCNFNF